MDSRTRGRVYGVSVLACALFIFGIVVPLTRTGRKAEDGFVITGQPQPSRPGPPRASVASPAPSPTPQAPASSAPAQPATVTVHVAGAVKHPGVYTLPSGKRAIDFLHAAGGPRLDADTDSMNLAAPAMDGTRIYVPSRTEHAPAASEDPAVGRPEGQGGRSGHGGKLSVPGAQGINLNTATVDELTQIPGIGPGIAGRIVQFRTINGPFTSPDQLTNVPGIGQKRYLKILPYVRVE